MEQNKKYTLEPYNTEDSKTLQLTELKNKFPSLEPLTASVYRSDQTNALSKLRNKGFKPLAWTPNVRYMYYNPERNLLVKDTEGDLMIVKNPSNDYLNDCLSYYPKAEVSHGEAYDERFPEVNA